VARYRITYRKLGRGRFISHLELIDIFASSFRRAGLPVAFTQGHHPKPRFRFGPGLPVGSESECETIDVDLALRAAETHLGSALDAQLPEGLSIAGVEEISLRHPAVETEMLAVRYRVEVGELAERRRVDEVDPVDFVDFVDSRVAAFLAAAVFPVVRRTGKGDKTIDARPLVSGLRRAGAVIELDLRFTLEGSVKPADLLAALFGLASEQARTLPIRKIAAFYRPLEPPPRAPVSSDPGCTLNVQH
jgi:radical SAM-linked protein